MLLGFLFLLLNLSDLTVQSERVEKSGVTPSHQVPVQTIKTSLTTRIDESLSSTNVTVVRGDTAMLVCTVLCVGDKSVSWVRLIEPNPQLMSLNNVTVTLNPRYKVLVTESREFVLMVRDVRSVDSGEYQCQVSGPQHTSLTWTVSLNVIEGKTEILDGPDIFVDRLSTLVLTCRIDFGPRTPDFIIWRKEDKILKFDGGETSTVPVLEVDSEGHHLSKLFIKEVDSKDSGLYVCQPAIGPQHSVTVHVLRRDTQVEAVVRGRGDDIPVLTLTENCAAPVVPGLVVVLLLTLGM